MKLAVHQKSPAALIERQRLRAKGQFWTPSWVADAMIAYVAQEAREVFDPAVGRGAFYTALKKITPEKKFLGADVDPEIMASARKEGIFDEDVKLEVRDFMLNPPLRHFDAIVANPPYVRHHRLSREQKVCLQKMSSLFLGEALDGRAGLHVYFLIQALNLLSDGGRLAFIMPADTCEGVFSEKLWSWISRKFCIDGIITFDHEATPFPGVDTNAVIFLIKNKQPQKKLVWAKCLLSQNSELYEFVNSDLKGRNYKNIVIYERGLGEALTVGLSRAPRVDHHFEFTLSDFARVMRGIATGANEFFFLTRERAKETGIPKKFLLPAIGRTRDVEGTRLTKKMLEALADKGRPTLLFSPNGFQWEGVAESVKDYIHEGERLGLAKRPLISTRNPWYRMEVRKVPPLLFAYLGRRNARFIKNDAGVVPLSGFLCVYPRSTEHEYVENLWKILQHPDTISNLQLVGKSYGSGAIKVEPRSLEKLPIPSNLVREFNLRPQLEASPPLF